METPVLIRRALLQGSRRPAIAGQSAASRRRGEGYEFAELRGYVTGDDPRRIDWAATARVGALQSRVMLEEHALFLVSILDESPSMHLGRHTSRISVAREALLLWNQACRAGDRCIMVSERESFEARGTTPELAAHACAEHQFYTKNIEQALRHADAVAPKGSALLLLTDGWSAIEEPTLHQVSARHDATVLLVRDPWCGGMPLRGFVRLKDSTSGIERCLYFRGSDERRYIEAVLRREAEIRHRFEVAGWRFGLLDNEPHDALRSVFIPSHATIQERAS